MKDSYSTTKGNFEVVLGMNWDNICSLDHLLINLLNENGNLGSDPKIIANVYEAS